MIKLDKIVISCISEKLEAALLESNMDGSSPKLVEFILLRFKLNCC
jgi:hypothetical protein